MVPKILKFVYIHMYIGRSKFTCKFLSTAIDGMNLPFLSIHPPKMVQKYLLGLISKGQHRLLKFVPSLNL